MKNFSVISSAVYQSWKPRGSNWVSRRVKEYFFLLNRVTKNIRQYFIQNRCRLLLQYLLNFANNVAGNCILIKYSWWILTVCWEIAVVWHVIAIQLLITFDDGFSIFRDVGKERQRENVSRCKEKYRKDLMRNSLKLSVFKTNLELRRLISDGITL